MDCILCDVGFCALQEGFFFSVGGRQETVFAGGHETSWSLSDSTESESRGHAQ